MIPKFTDGYFSVDSEHGFLPIHEPLSQLPTNFLNLQNILDTLSNDLMNTENDLLLEKISTLQNYLEDIKLIDDKLLLGALYRGYCFLASGYLLYPSYVEFCRTGQYGLGRERLPINIAQPLIYLAETLDVYPFLEYSYSYSLGNYVKRDKTKGLDYENLSMANHFSGTVDETGFIMVHVDINQHTPDLIKYSDLLLETYNVENLNNILLVLKRMNESRRKMWKASRWEHYNDFRVFIMGIKGNTRIFPNGVIYEPETEPRYYRGQSGSQDTIIPFLDNFFRVCDYYPKNELTEYLMDMRSYRPKPFRDILDWIAKNNSGFIDRLLSMDTDGDICSLLFQIYKQIYEFRNGHWQFVQKYIMSTTKYPVATGGTPITTWLPNQIVATLQAMRRVLNEAEKYHHYDKNLWLHYEEDFSNMIKLLEEQIKILNSEVEYRPNEVFSLNSQFKQSDN